MGSLKCTQKWRQKVLSFHLKVRLNYHFLWCRLEEFRIKQLKLRCNLIKSNCFNGQKFKWASKELAVRQTHSSSYLLSRLSKIILLLCIPSANDNNMPSIKLCIKYKSVPRFFLNIAPCLVDLSYTIVSQNEQLVTLFDFMVFNIQIFFIDV